MTSQEFSDIVVNEQLREKLVNKLQRDYVRYRHRADDWTARAILIGLRASSKIEDAPRATAFVMETGTRLAIKDLTQETARRNALHGLPKPPVRRDPMRRIDYKVDLEKAIRLTTGHKIMQQALWHIHFEEWTWDEAIEALPKYVSISAWRKRLWLADADLQRRMRAYGYR